jgi:magnesium-transporting ATPase (P-type)
LLRTNELRVDEAMLTGESLPVEKTTVVEEGDNLTHADLSGVSATRHSRMHLFPNDKQFQDLSAKVLRRPAQQIGLILFLNDRQHIFPFFLPGIGKPGQQNH